MKNIFFKVTFTLAMVFTCNVANAQINLGNILSGIKEATENSQTNNGKNIIESLTTIFSGDKVATKEKIIGTWIYTEPAIVFENDGFLENAGGKLISSTLENRLQKQLEKYGIKKGQMKMTFDKNGNFTQTFLGKTLSGTYTIEDKNVILKYGGTISQIVGTTQIDGNNLLIVMNATKLLKYVKLLGSFTSNSTLKTATSLLGNMKGMECGVKLEKE